MQNTNPTEDRVPVFDLADRVRKALREANVSNLAMAEYLGVSTKTIGNYVNGHTRPDTRTLKLWALSCGVPYEWLATGVVTVSGDPNGPVTARYPDACVLVLRPNGSARPRLATAA